MASQALYLKYRPQTYDAVVGQAHVTQTLRNALVQGRLRHAYLFCGPRGTGKTTTARLLAKAVNCLAAEEQRPCNACTLCNAINDGRLLDLIEIDAASNRGIDEIRDLREKVGFRPNEARYKVYVLDEAHMLTDPAFNALLKTLEEPPPHVIFILVTTDPQKIPATITSRCQRFDFRRVGLEDIIERLRYIATQEGLTAEPAALEMIAYRSTGGMRDAISLLDQMTSYGGAITLARLQSVLGTVGGEAASKLVACLVSADIAGGLGVINRNVAEGSDPRQFASGVVEYLRGLLLIQEGAGTRLLNVTAEQAVEMETMAGRLALDHLLQVIKLFNEAATELKRGYQEIPQLPLEMAFVESVLSGMNNEPTRGASAPQRAPSWPPYPVTPEEPPARRTPSETASTEPSTQEATTPTARTADPEPPAPTASRPVTAAPQAPAAGGPSIADVTAQWDQILAAVRQRNPTSYAALRSGPGCQPVEVNGNEVMITFPWPVLRDKLVDPQRRKEIQDAVSEVVGTSCSIRLVLVTEYTPSRVLRETVPTYKPDDEPAVQSPAAARGAAAAQDEAAAGPDPNEIDRYDVWAKQRGGHVVP